MAASNDEQCFFKVSEIAEIFDCWYKSLSFSLFRAICSTSVVISVNVTIIFWFILMVETLIEKCFKSFYS